MSCSTDRAVRAGIAARPDGRRGPFDRLKASAPFGQALLIGLLTMLASGALLVLTTPFAEHYRVLLDDERAVAVRDVQPELRAVAGWASAESHCAVQRPGPDEPADWIVDCRFPGPEDIAPLRDALPDGLELRGYHLTMEFPDTFAPASLPAAISLLMPLAVGLLLLRGPSWREDASRAAAFLRRRPWVPLLTPLLAFVSLPLFSAALPEGRPVAPEAVSALFPPMILISFVIAAPVLEEALFRHWAYRRTVDRLPILWVAVGSTWCFMLLHAFNPQVAWTWAYLPTVFVIGLGLFWIRHRSGSILLTIGCHALHNLLAVIGLLTAFAAMD
ncbi:CPBP family intramembrane glutamic endopeptidase [Halomonas denitrificans]|nr:CPBP family intramembrane metalloprotease [Halomonas denitrificans]